MLRGIITHEHTLTYNRYNYTRLHTSEVFSVLILKYITIDFYIKIPTLKIHNTQMRVILLTL